jgi:alkaline phosphatase D
MRVAPEDLTVEFVCIPRPIERSASADGGPLAYRASHRVRLWGAGETPTLVRASQEGALPLVP